MITDTEESRYLAWDNHKNVAVLNPLIEFQPSILHISVSYSQTDINKQSKKNLDILWKIKQKFKNIDGQQFHLYQQNEQSPLISNNCTQKGHNIYQWKHPKKFIIATFYIFIWDTLFSLS